MKPIIFITVLVFFLYTMMLLYTLQTNLAKQVEEKTDCKYIPHLKRPAELIC